jgi:glycosyltransferase involved in cell wall biosynthesis
VISKLLFRSKAKLIWWHHHYPWYYSQKANVYIKLKRFFEKCIIKSVDCVIANSKYLQGIIKNIYKIDSKILHPVLDDKFLNHNSENKKLSDTSKTIFTYGRWVEGKNLEMIFNTYDDLKNKISNLTLII